MIISSSVGLNKTYYNEFKLFIFSDVAIRKFKIISVAPIIFLQDNIGLKWGLAHFPVSGQIVNIIGIRESRTVSVTHSLGQGPDLVCGPQFAGPWSRGSQLKTGWHPSQSSLPRAGGPTQSPLESQRKTY